MPQTTGLVQRLKWTDSNDTLFAFVGPTPAVMQLFSLPFAGADAAETATRRVMAHLLGKAMAAGAPATLTHDAGGSTITGVDVRFTRVRADALEVTQSVQNLAHGVALIARKAAVVRAYLSLRSGPAVTVRGELTVRRLPSGSPVTVASLNAVLLDPAQFGQTDFKRRDLARSLNFRLPADQTDAGPVEVQLTGVTDAATGAALDPGLQGFTRNVTFTQGAPLRVRVVSLTYQQNTPPVTFAPTANDLAMIESWLLRAYPVAVVDLTRATVAATAAVPFTSGDANAQVAAIRALDVANGTDARTHYYGLVADGGFFMRGGAAIPGTPDPAAVGSGPTGAGNWGWDFDGSYGDWYTGHELGHTLGRLHPGFCGETNDDNTYPFANGQLSNADNAFVGFDVGDAALGLPMAALPGDVWHDVMTYCNNQWLSSYTYEGIRTRLLAEDAMPAGPVPGGGGRPDERFPDAAARAAAAPVARPNLVSVVATVNLSKSTGAIRFVHPLPRGTPGPAGTEGAVVLRVLKADGGLLHEFPVPVKPFENEPGEDRQGMVDVILAVHPDAKSVELWVAGKLADTFGAAAPPPAVRQIRRAQGEPSALALTWQSDAAPGGRNTYTVQASTDNGATWATLAVGLATPEAAIDKGQFRGAKQVLIRVSSTDGFTSSPVTSETLDLDGP